MTSQSLNPYDGTILKTFEELSDEQLEAAVHAGINAQQKDKPHSMYLGIHVSLLRRGV